MTPDDPRHPPQTSDADEADAAKRAFLKRFGGYAATAPAALVVLMSPRTSRAVGSGGPSDEGPY